VVQNSLRLLALRKIDLRHDTFKRTTEWPRNSIAWLLMAGSRRSRPASQADPTGLAIKVTQCPQLSRRGGYYFRLV